MLKTLRRAALLAAGLLASLSAAAQTYPYNSPVYTPSAVLSAQTLSAVGTTVYVVNGVGTVNVTVSGTYTGLAAEFDVTPSRAATATWTKVNVLPLGAAASSKPFNAITANGTYQVQVQGMAQLRFNVTGLSTGSVVTEWAGALDHFHVPASVDTGALITNAGQGAATVNSADQVGVETTTIICVFNQSSHTGTPSTIFGIQGKDAASGNYYALVTSLAITADGTPTILAVGPGVATTANVSAGLPVPAAWRVSETVGGTTPGVTGTIGCSVH